jgi:CHRD domain
MRRHVWLGGVTLVATMALSNCTDKVGIQVSERFAATLSGANERPTPVTTSATGSATFTYVADIPALFYRIDVAGIDSAFAAHIHAPADTGHPAGVVVTLFNGPTTPLGFSGVLAQGVAGAPAGMTPDSVLVLLRNGNAYVNVHTRGPTGANGSGGHLGGEIRGQVVRQ